MQVRYDDWVERAQRRLAGQPPALLRRAGPGLVPARARRRARPRRRRIVPDEARLPVDPTTDVPEGYTAGPAGRAGRLRRRPRRHGHLGHLVGHPADRLRLGGRPGPVRRHLPDGPAAAGPRDHPHLALLHPAALAPRARRRCRGGTPPSTAGSSTRTARRCRSRRATSSRPMALLEEFGSDAVRYWACNGRPGTDTALDKGVMKIGRRLAIKILNASKFALGPARRGPGPGPRRGARAARRRAAGRSWPTLVDAATAAHEGFDYARALELTESSSGPSATTTSSWSRRAPTARARRPGPTRPGPPWPWPCPPCTGSSHPSSPSSPRRSGAGGRRARCTGRPGRRWPRSGRTPAPSPAVLDVAAEVLGAVRREKTAQQALHAGPGGAAHRDGAARDARSTSRRRGATSSTPAGWTTS